MLHAGLLHTHAMDQHNQTAESFNEYGNRLQDCTHGSNVYLSVLYLELLEVGVEGRVHVLALAIVTAVSFPWEFTTSIATTSPH